jgi:hypothetical protein
MIGALIAITSLNLTQVLIQDYGVVAQTWPITAATTTTPITVTSAAHGVPLGRVVHGMVSGVGGETEANGLWVLTPTDADTFALSTFTAQGETTNSVGVNAYTSGGQIQAAFPEWSILLGRRNLALAGAVASPRIVFIPTAGKRWSFEAYAGAAPDLQPAVYPRVRGSSQQQAMTLQPQFATEYTTFEVWVFGCATNYGAASPSPDFLDFDATQALVYALMGVMFNEAGAGFQILREDWPSQKPESGLMTQRGQAWMGIVEVQQGASLPPLTFVPLNVQGQITVEPVNPGSSDPIVIDIT